MSTAAVAAAMPADEKPSFIVFSEDWGEHPSSCQHLFHRIAREHRVLWVNTVGMRTPRLTMTDLRKARLKLAKMLSGTRSGSAARAESLNLRVSQPRMLPFPYPIVRRWNRRSVVGTVSREWAQFSGSRPIVVCAIPNPCDYVDALDARRVVYYCVDDFTQWPGLDHRLVREMDEAMIGASDVLIATSAKLEARLSRSGKPTFLLQHGVDLELFSKEAADTHAVLAGIPGPRAGYFGLFNERNDIELIAALARRMPDLSFVFTGPVTTDTSALKAFPNVHFTGAIPYRELPRLIAGLDVLFIPYLVNDFTDSISPLKLKEYLATGRPVVTTPMAEAMPLAEHMAIAKGAQEWESALREALTVDVAVRKKRLAGYLRRESWDEKAAQFLHWCVDGCPP
ncbi:MAG: glycosyltransferase [Gammaproteobacteria bacterium]